jgi:Ca-dependent carbohydrate-binding module xylan-binding
MNTRFFLFPFAGLLCAAFLLSLHGCSVRVEKIEKYGVNDQQFEHAPAIGSWTEMGEVFRFCCNGTISTHPSELNKGSYDVVILAKGDPAYQVYPLIRIMVNDTALGEIRLDDHFTTYRLPLVVKEKKPVAVQIAFDQDGLDDKGNDRDVLIKRINVTPK